MQLRSRWRHVYRARDDLIWLTVDCRLEDNKSYAKRSLVAKKTKQVVKLRRIRQNRRRKFCRFHAARIPAWRTIRAIEDGKNTVTILLFPPIEERFRIGKPGKRFRDFVAQSRIGIVAFAYRII